LSLGHHHEALLGVFEGPPSIPGEADVKCPICRDHSPPTWQHFYTRINGSEVAGLPSEKNVLEDVQLDWMRCSNEECEQLIVRVHEQRITGVLSPLLRTDSWIARPRFGETERPIHALVPEPFRTDYAEAAAILEISHRMSAVLSRRILGDLLKKYAGKEQGTLAAQIDAFTGESGHPSSVTSNLHHFREVANFGAHTQEDQQAEDGEPVVIDVDRDEAEWTLDMVDRLFDYFIVQPAKDEEIKSRMDEKIQRAGRKPLRPNGPGDAGQS
jgi:Domain of unknown function (DUF4145)